MSFQNGQTECFDYKNNIANNQSSDKIINMKYKTKQKSRLSWDNDK